MVELYRTMLLSRLFALKVQELPVYGTYHLSIGQEASHTGLIAGLEPSDWIVPTHRCHGFNIARGSGLFEMFSELLGSRHGLCKGIGGSMHMTDTATFNFGSSAVVGSGIPLAGGLALSSKLLGKDSIAVAIFGDGASSRGTLHEMLNLASVWDLPLLFYLENNHYGMSAASARMVSTHDIYKRAEGYSVESAIVDGNDVVAVKAAVEKARAYIKENGRPYFLEADTYRRCGHSRSDRLVYRPQGEAEAWKDPVEDFRERLEALGYDLSAVEAEAEELVDAAAERALRMKDDTLGFDELSSYVSAPLPSVSWTGSTHTATFREAIREALAEILEGDERVYLIGEDIGRYGGCFGVTGDLWSRFPGRLLETPVSEETFTGMAAGAAASGLRPIVELMYGDFSTLASDPVINHAAKLRFMSAGQLHCPMILRAPMGGGTGHGAQHSQSLESLFLGIPGLAVVAPSDPYSAKALLKSAALSEDPVVFLEHKMLYSEEGPVGDGETCMPLGKCRVEGSGDGLLVIGYSHAYALARKVLEPLSGKITFIDLCTVQPLDTETLRREIRRVPRALIVQDPPLGGSVADTVRTVLGDDAKVRIAAGRPMPVPVSRKLEEHALLSPERIWEEALNLIP